MKTKQEYQEALNKLSRLARLYVDTQEYEPYFTEEEYEEINEMKKTLKELIDNYKDNNDVGNKKK